MERAEGSLGHGKPTPAVLMDIAALIRAIQRGSDGVAEATDALQTLVVRLPESESHYLYPWYCLLVALASDLLDARKDGTGLFEPHEIDIVHVLNRAGYAWHLFSMEKALPPFDPGVGEFLDLARRLFVQVCWSIIDPDNHQGLSEESKDELWQRLVAAVHRAP